MARLGLRASEVANLTFGDIDWKHGRITLDLKTGEPWSGSDKIVDFPCILGAFLRRGEGAWINPAIMIGRARGASVLAQDARSYGAGPACRCGWSS
ncbi:hypothetical protein [Mesorhizobium sp. AR02]|uniref:hypothetical protein n=1 Tax=Mesorhizobium sp. AR02 TaxID=2865837 RepID=UPI0029621ABC|nr:hypothetical protein [Mesorhizobium sp. AR02]